MDMGSTNTKNTMDKINSRHFANPLQKVFELKKNVIKKNKNIYSSYLPISMYFESKGVPIELQRTSIYYKTIDKIPILLIYKHRHVNANTKETTDTA